MLNKIAISFICGIVYFILDGMYLQVLGGSKLMEMLQQKSGIRTTNYANDPFRPKLNVQHYIALFGFCLIIATTCFLLIGDPESNGKQLNQINWGNVIWKSALLGASAYMCLEAANYATLKKYPSLLMIVHSLLGIVLCIITSVVSVVISTEVHGGGHYN